jgi:hypothetical protein
MFVLPTEKQRYSFLSRSLSLALAHREGKSTGKFPRDVSKSTSARGTQKERMEDGKTILPPT